MNFYFVRFSSDTIFGNLNKNLTCILIQTCSQKLDFRVSKSPSKTLHEIAYLAYEFKTPPYFFFHL
jgi:hypothetical protein